VKNLPPNSAVLLALLFAAPLAAQEAPTAENPERRSITFSAGAGATDNIKRVESGEQSETILSAGLKVDVNQSTRRLDTELLGDLNYLSYLDNTYDNELVGRLDGDLRVALAPGRLFWDFHDNYGQSQVDPLAPVTPENREDVNYFSTGPDVALKLGSSGFAELAARYSDVAYELSPLDSRRVFAGVGFGRELASGSRLSLHVDWQRIDFDDDVVNTDYDLASTYARYEVKGARTEFFANVGAIQFDDGNKDSGPFVQLELTRQMSSASKLVVGAGRQFTDAASVFRDRPPLTQGVSTTAPPTLSSDVFDRSYVDANWQYERHRTGVVVSARYSDDEYENRKDLNVKRTELVLSLSRQLTPTISGSVFASHSDSDYDNAGFTDKMNTFGLGMSYLVGRRLVISLDAADEKRSVEGGGNGYDELRGFLTFGYRVR